MNKIKRKILKYLLINEKQEVSYTVIKKAVIHKLFGYNFSDGLIYKFAVYLILFTISYVFIFPILKMISLTFMSSADVIDPTVDWVPKNPSLNNIFIASKVLNIKSSFFNSMWFAGFLALTQTFVSAMTGFAFARYNFKFKNFWFVMILLTFILPVPVVLIPRIMMFTTIQDATSIKMFGTIIPQFLMSIFGQGVNSAILILIFYNFFKMIPSVLDEAARIDGATSIQVFYHIIIKMSIPTILLVFMFSFIWNWNETYVTSTFVRSGIQLLPTQLSVFDSLFTSVGSQSISATELKINEAYKMAGTLISIIPLLIMYLFVQRHFIEGIEKTGITGE